MKLKYLFILFGVFYAGSLITAPTKNKSKRNTRTRQTSKRRPTQKRSISKGRGFAKVGSSRGGIRVGGGGFTPTPTPTPTQTTQNPPTTLPQTPPKPQINSLKPLDINVLDRKIIRLDSAAKTSIKKTKDKLQEIKNTLDKEKAELMKLRETIQKKPLTLKEIEESYTKELDAKKNPQNKELVL